MNRKTPWTENVLVPAFPVLFAGLLFCAFGACHAAEPPVAPVGLDAYRQWDRWPYQRIGVRAYMRSTYDRSSRNEGADASHFLCQLADDFNVSLDVEGPGILYFARTNYWHGSPWHYEVDGTDHIVQESSTANPTHAKGDSVFLPETPFPNPLTWTWSATKGADLMWVPIAFERSFRMAYARTHFGTGYYIYHQFVPGTKLSQPLKAWDGAEAPAKDVLDLINRAGTDLVPHAGTPEGDRARVQEAHGEISLPERGVAPLFESTQGPAMLRALELSIPLEAALDVTQARIRITWDGRPAASVDAPIPLFFGAGILYNRDRREYLVKAFPVNIRYTADRVQLHCYFPMPFFRSAKIELMGGDKAVAGIQWSVRTMPYNDPINAVGYFHATYRDHPAPERYKDLVLLDTRQVEGGGDWSGQFVGTSFIFSHEANLTTLEGNPRFFFDDAETPQGQGTGTEEWGGGGGYWGGRNMTIPFAGHPTGGQKPKITDDNDKIESAYRFLLADLMPFGKNARIELEHGGSNTSKEHYETVTYWYGAPAASLTQTDALAIGDAESERAHQYVSPDASAAYELTSRFDSLGCDQGVPVSTDRGRITKGTSEFVMALTPENYGVMLRRKLDYQYPDQRAEVSVADVADSGEPKWQPAGVWYLAGSNTCVYSNPDEELGATEHRVETSNRRFRDDEFLIPRALTEGRKTVRVRVRFRPVSRPLFPGQPVPELAWSEMRYTAYCYVMPDVKLPSGY